MRRRVALPITIAAVLTLVALTLFILTRPLRRRLPFRVPRAAPPVLQVQPILARLPPERWTERLVRLEDSEKWDQLDRELRSVQQSHPRLYDQFQLRYLHARVKQQLEQYEEATALFTPYLELGNPFRDLALYHLAEIAVEDERPDQAAGYRDELIFAHPKSLYRAEVIGEQIEYFAAAGNLSHFTAFAGRLRPAAETSLRRVIDSFLIELLVREGALVEAKERGMRLLRGETGDDAAERTFQALNRPEIVGSLTVEGLMLLGQAAQAHRHFDRAVELLATARAGLPQKRDDLTFAIGRSYFGQERYEEAEKTYLEGAAAAKSAEARATLFFHASRCAQLLGDDARAERVMMRAIAVPGRFPSTSAALTQRLRTRAQAKRFAAAAGDLRLLGQLFPNRHGVVEAGIALATARIAAGQFAQARQTLAAIPAAALQPHDRPEIDYWLGRALEPSDPAQALQSYLKVLRAPVPTHFAYLVRQRVGGPYRAAALREAEQLRSEVQKAIAEKSFDRARRLQTDMVLLAPAENREVEMLRAIYREIPRYRQILELEPRQFPRFPLPSGAPRGDLLFAMGLFDEVATEIEQRYPLRSLQSALTAAHAYHLAGASRSSLYAIEVLVRNVPNDFIPELLPRLVRELLYPRYFLEFIQEDSESYDADPVLVLAMMREESRFNPAAKSVAAARGLLQFILTTASQIGRDLGITELTSEDLYDPRIVIQLGAKYIGDLLEQFNRNIYQTAAAFNAGPNQAKLWARLAPAPGDDFYLSAINFEETKHYVRKVMNSYHRYHEIYGAAGPTGGLRAEP